MQTSTTDQASELAGIDKVIGLCIADGDAALQKCWEIHRAEVVAKHNAGTGHDGYDTAIEVDASKLRVILEATRGTSLVEKPEKLEAWRNGTTKTDATKNPIELVFNDAGQLDVNDGRHRIALAAERGESVTVFIDSKTAWRAIGLTA